MGQEFDSQAQRNIMGKRLEWEDKVLEALALYKANVSENFEGSFPYRRLSVLYRKRKMYADEIRILEKDIFVFAALILTGRSDVLPKLDEFRDRLKRVKQITFKV